MPKKNKSTSPSQASGPNASSTDSSVETGASNSAQQDAMAAEQRAMRTRLESEKSGILGASSFDGLARVIDSSKSDNKGEAAIKLRNTEKGVARARAYFDKNGMDAEAKAFIDDRYAGALSDQQQGIAVTSTKPLALTGILAKSDPDLEEANYSDLQWGAVFGPNAGTTLKQELLSNDDVAATVEVAANKGGLAKLVGIKGMWGSMDAGLKDLWKQVYKTEALAYHAWKASTLAQSSPAIQPSIMDNGVSALQFRPYTSLAKAFPNPTNGCMGMGEDYQFSSIGEACNALGLKPEWYADGGFILSIPGAGVEAAAAAAVDAGGGVGKATVFTSLMFSEFNYIAEDRATNETESGDSTVNANAKQNSGTKSGGKTEVVVTKLPAAALLAQSPKLLV
ncbi:MAG: hypothetical protein KC912_13390 [Proteobacteria bacterium]|nr:hypothetical protein [Pseudomonadota bacterium]